MLFFDALLDQLFLADLPLAVAKLKAFMSSAAKLKEDTTETPTELSRLVNVTCVSEVMFRKTKLTGVSTTVQHAFKNNRPLLVDKMLACVTNRFDDLHSIDAMKGVRLLNFVSWPIDTPAFDTFGDLEVSLLSNHCWRRMKSHSILSQQSGVLSRYYAAQNLQGNSNIWPLSHYRGNFPNLAHLIEILLLFPISNATVERGFSTMKRINGDLD